MPPKYTDQMTSALAGLTAAIFCSLVWLTGGLVIATQGGVVA